MNEDREVSSARFSLMPISNTWMMCKFEVHSMLETWAHNLLETIPNLTMRNRAKKVMIGGAFSNLYTAMWRMEISPFIKMNEDFFHLCKDAINDAESINFKVGTIQAQLLDLAKAYLGKGEFGMTRGDTTRNLDKWIKE